MSFHAPPIEEVNKAHKVFEANEPRDLFYRVATELVNLAICGTTSLSLAEALAVLLQTWNRAFYRFRKFNHQHFSDIERCLNCHEQVLLSLRQRSIKSFCEEDEIVVKRIFGDFEEVLGPVGAAKCLHLLAPHFFPLWDRAIAQAYGLTLRQKGRNAERYCHFMRITKNQCKFLDGKQIDGQNLLKALDEYNYCKYTKQWV